MDNATEELLYRPTVRYDPIYRKYVNELFHATDLDRNEIMRLALFCAPLGALFRSKVERHLKPGKTFPEAPWGPQDGRLWERGDRA